MADDKQEEEKPTVETLSGHEEGKVLPNGEKVTASYGPQIVFDDDGNPVVDEDGEVAYEKDSKGKVKQVFLGWHKEPAEDE